MDNEKVFAMLFAKVYPMLIAKAERKGRTQEEVLEVTTWLTGYTHEQIEALLAKSICEPMHLHIWDEPMNYIDVISRMQIEALLLEYQPTMLFVEHDKAFCDNVATKVVKL